MDKILGNKNLDHKNISSKKKTVIEASVNNSFFKKTKDDQSSITSLSSLNSEASVLPAQNFKQLYEAFKLVHDEYHEAGLSKKSSSGLRFYLRELLPDSTTFVTLHKEKVIATVTVIRWSMASVPAFNIYGDELSQIIKSGSFFAEATKFASVARKISGVSEKRKPVIIFEELLKTIFHWCGILGVDQWISVIHPRQIPYYTKKLGFQVLGSEKTCEHVKDKPGVLIKLDIRSMLNGRTTPFKYLGKKMLDVKPSISQFQNYHFLSSFEVLFLLFEDPSVIEKASISERALFDFYYPGVLEIIEYIFGQEISEKMEERNRTIAYPVTPYLKNFKFLKMDKEEVDLYSLFDAKLLFQKLFYLAEVYAKQNSITLEFGLKDFDNSLFYGQYNLIAFIISSICKKNIDSAKSKYLPLDIEIKKRNHRKNTINFRFVSDEKLDLIDFIDEIERLSGTFCTAQNIEGKWLNQLSFNILNISEANSSSILTSDVSEKSYIKSDTVILIAEHNLLDQMATKRILEKRGFKAITAQNGEEALKIVSQTKIDLALFNVSLPLIDGLTLTSKLRTELGVRFPILAFTASISESNIEKIYRAGMNDLIFKPQSIKKLYEKIDYHLAHSFIADGKPHLFRVA